MGCRSLFVVAQLLLFIGGCIESNLLPCGDLTCPAGASCVANHCVSSEQLTACDGKPDGELCIVFDAEGRCTGGACQVVRCGNGVIDPGELCDDGNRQDGDGCRGDCLSDETCGNGVLDPRERCDCGRDEGTRPAGCDRSNDDAIGALCDTQCSRYCGDGQITGPEACDGTAVTATCTDFGFYDGTVGCTPFCTLVPACTGKCGDGVVQGAEGELCDTAPPASMSCLDFGRDYGALGCNSFCSPDITHDCNSYGPELILTDDLLSASFGEANANSHGAMAYKANQNQLLVAYDGARFVHDAADVTRVVATPTALVGLGATTTLRFDGGGWMTLPALGAITGAATEGDELYVVDASCVIRRLTVPTGAIVTMSSPVLGGCTGIDVLGGALVVATADTLAWRTTTAWQTASLVGAPDRVLWLDAGTVVLQTGSALDRYELATGTRTSIGPVTTFVTANDELVSLTYTSALQLAIRLGLHVFTTTGPSAAFDDLPRTARSGDGGIVVWYSNQVYRLRPAWTTDTDPATAVVVQPDGSVAYCGPTTVSWSAADGTTSTRTLPTGVSCNSVAGPVTGVHYLGTSQGIYRFDLVSNSYVVDRAGAAVVYAQGATIWATQFEPFPNLNVLRNVNGTWTADSPLMSDCSVVYAFATTATDAYASVYCTAGFRLYRHTAGAWTPITPATQTTQTYQLWTALDGTLFGSTGGSSFARLDGTGWTLIPTSSVPSELAARARDDVYLRLGQQLVHWDGTRSALLRGPGGTVGNLVALPQALLAHNGPVASALIWFGPQPAGL